MPFIVYVYKDGGAVPYMEVLPQSDRDAARDGAFTVMKQHQRVERAELWQDEKLIEQLKLLTAYQSR